MFGIGFFELCIIVIVALIFVGPHKLPEMMNHFGRFFVQMRRISHEVKSSMDEVIYDAEQELNREELEKNRKVISKTKDAIDPHPEPTASEEIKHKPTTLTEPSLHPDN